MLLGLVVETAPEAADRCGVLGPAEGGGRQAPASAPPALTGSELSARLAQRPGFAPTRNNYTPAPPGRHFDPRYLITVADAPVPSGKSGQPQYRQAPQIARQPTGLSGFGLCAGFFTAFNLPTFAGCGVWGDVCTGGGIIACPAALATCGYIGSGLLHCLGAAFPNTAPGLNSAPFSEPGP